MAKRQDYTVDQGSIFSFVINVLDSNQLARDLTNYSARGQIRRHHSSSTAIDFVATVTDAPNGEITVSLSAEDSAVLTGEARYVYDIEIYDNSSPVNVERVQEGQLYISPRVTNL